MLALLYNLMSFIVLLIKFDLIRIALVGSELAAPFLAVGLLV